jgi:hypothetical protein
VTLTFLEEIVPIVSVVLLENADQLVGENFARFASVQDSIESKMYIKVERERERNSYLGITMID